MIDSPPTSKSFPKFFQQKFPPPPFSTLPIAQSKFVSFSVSKKKSKGMSAVTSDRSRNWPPERMHVGNQIWHQNFYRENWMNHIPRSRYISKNKHVFVYIYIFIFQVNIANYSVIYILPSRNMKKHTSKISLNCALPNLISLIWKFPNLRFFQFANFSVRENQQLKTHTSCRKARAQ